MRKAFTLIELVFVIVVIGILAATIIPSTKRSVNAEAAIKLQSHLRYAQHLAMIDDKFSSTSTTWKTERWKIVFTPNSYSVMSNATYAKDTELNNKELKDIVLPATIILSHDCSAKTEISFDNLGRPYMDTTPNVNNLLLHANCLITLVHDGEANEVLTITPETGYVKRN